MSIASLVRNPEVKDLFASVIVRPGRILPRPMVAPPLTQNYRRAGTAFDYLFRFYLQRLNRRAKAGTWVADVGVEKLLMTSFTYDIDKDEHAIDPKTAFAIEIRRHASQQYQRYIKSGTITDDLLKSTLRLAKLDLLHRAGLEYIDDAISDNIGKSEIRELRNLISAVNRKSFIARHACVLNPTFGFASQLAGADADIVIDDKIIEVKTTQFLNLDRRDLYQLVAYYVLLLLDGVTIRGPDNKHMLYAENVSEITHLGIYFSRHGYLHLWPVRELLMPDALLDFTARFIEYCCPNEDRRVDLLHRCRGRFSNEVRKYIEKRASVDAAARKRNKKRPG